MKVALGSAFRNSASHGHLPRYEAQMCDLRDRLADFGHSLFPVLVEGDSTDDTKAQLEAMLNRFANGVLGDVTHGGPWFGSTEAPERFRALAGVGNGILSRVPDDATVLVYVESDLIWDGRTMLNCLGRLSHDVDVVSPLIFAGKYFYDVFAYRGLDGNRFAPFHPYHSMLNGFSEVSSVGSCLVMKADVARNCRIPLEEGLVGFCRDARSKGYRIWVDTRAGIVRHP